MAKERQAQAEGTSAPSIISKGVRLTGELTSTGELQLDGHFEGRVRCHQLTIGESGSLAGEAQTEIAVIKGRFSGQLVARSIRITETAHVEGDIYQDNIAIEAGATIRGRLLAREGHEEATDGIASLDDPTVAQAPADIVDIPA